jgi:glycine oxidase
VVLGGGVIGMSVALELALGSFDCTLVDPSPARGASWAAGGMLSPAAEVAPGEDELLADLVAAAEAWPEFARRVESVSGVDVGYASVGSILVGYEQSDAREGARFVEQIARAGLDVVTLSSSELATIEPSLAGGLRGGWRLAGDHRVDNRLLLDALLAGLKALGVRIVEDTCTEVTTPPRGVRVELAHQGGLDADRCIVATGAAPPPEGVRQLGLPRIRPVRGVTLRLDATAGIDVPTHTIRAIVRGVHCYLVPRGDGALVIGATSEEQGHSQIARAGGIFQLLEASRAVLPGIDELALGEVAVGLRPTTDDHVPHVGHLDDHRVIAAVGHYRNGLLLAPLTARRVLELSSMP